MQPTETPASGLVKSFPIPDAYYKHGTPKVVDFIGYKGEGLEYPTPPDLLNELRTLNPEQPDTLRVWILGQVLPDNDPDLEPFRGHRDELELLSVDIDARQMTVRIPASRKGGHDG